MPQKEAATRGYVQNLWLHGPEHYLTEVCGTRILRQWLALNKSQLLGWNYEPLCCLQTTGWKFVHVFL